jgi:phosphoribosylglycinamide formyltransferase 1
VFSTPARIVALVSGAGTNLEALIQATSEPAYGAVIVAVGSDREGVEGLARAERAGIPTFTRRLDQFETREGWDRALRDLIARFEPDLIILAGFMKLLGEPMLEAFPGRIFNTHPALCPAFPGMSGPQDALDYGVKFTGATLFVVDGGVDTGPIVAQCVVPVLDEDNRETLHNRIKVAERQMLVETVGRLSREGYHLNGRKVHFGP